MLLPSVPHALLLTCLHGLVAPASWVYILLHSLNGLVFRFIYTQPLARFFHSLGAPPPKVMVCALRIHWWHLNLNLCILDPKS